MMVCLYEKVWYTVGNKKHVFYRIKEMAGDTDTAIWESAPVF